MIQKIAIRKIATYGESGITFNPTKVNYIFGSNGTGKTTLSRVIKQPENYAECSLEWEHKEKLNALVYNREFVEDVVVNNPRIKGVFTLGKDSGNAQIEIDEKRQELDQVIKDIDVVESAVTQKDVEIGACEDLFEKKCWQEKTLNDESFREVFSGVRGTKARFKEKVIKESTNVADLKDLQYLNDRYKVLYKQSPISLPNLTKLQLAEFEALDRSDILNRRLVGKDTVDIAAMIKKLNNSDWVERGVTYLEQNDGVCPFCQRHTDEEFRKQLEGYFDTNYRDRLQELKNYRIDYLRAYENIIRDLGETLENSNPYLDTERISKELETLRSFHNANLMIIDKKINEPSQSLDIKSLLPEFNTIQALIEQAIVKTINHNSMISNLAQERSLLSRQVWRLISENLKHDFLSYQTQKNALNGAKSKLEDKQFEYNRIRKELTQQIGELEEKITATSYSVTTVNKYLKSFGFNSFTLEEADKPGYYRLARNDDSDANNSLSEGEKSFVAFLYFYQLTQGSITPEKVTENRIVVYDDPVSSLDSTTMFMVSAMIRNTVAQVQQGVGSIKQIFILTHNTYFYKELTQQRYKNKTQGKSYWVLKISNDLTSINQHEHNPIKNSYEILWDEVRKPDTTSAISLQNTMRRIIIFYFEILGCINIDRLSDQFEGDDMVIFRSFINWMHEGSHVPSDDLFIDYAFSAEQYCEVFKKIFYATGHESHYNMMMKIEAE